jgi:hypothetical protein
MTIKKLTVVATIATIIGTGATIAALYGADVAPAVQTIQGSDNNQAGSGGSVQTGSGHIAIVGSPGASIAIPAPRTTSTPYLRDATPVMNTLDIGDITGPNGEDHVVCREIAGTPVAIRDEKVITGIAFVLIEIRSGPHAGKIGWVASERVARQ